MPFPGLYVKGVRRREPPACVAHLKDVFSRRPADALAQTAEGFGCGNIGFMVGCFGRRQPGHRVPAFGDDDRFPTRGLLEKRKKLVLAFDMSTSLIMDSRNEIQHPNGELPRILPRANSKLQQNPPSRET